MPRSMTGFGRGGYSQDGKEFTVEIKTVNHRYSDISIRMPRQLGFMEDKVRELAAKSISRGKTDVFITYNNRGGDEKSVTLDEALAKAYISAVEALRDKFGLRDDITVSFIAKCPDVLKAEQNEEDEEALWAILKVAVENAIDSLIKMREIEGEKLKNVLLDRTAYIESLIKEISKRAPEVPKEYKTRMEMRLKELLGQQAADESRIVMEAAVFADRCCIDEELVRLESHIGQLKDTLSLNVPAGRKLDFIVQEMNREINTIGSKANDLAITRNVVEIKSEIEKIREQVQNIE